MKKEELISAVGKALNASGKDETIAFDIFLRKIIEKLDVEGVLRVPEIGIFQLSRFKPGPQSRQTDSEQSLYINVIPQEASKPGTAPEIITLPAGKKVNDSDFDESIFSLSVDQPLIPVSDSRKSEFIVQSGYAMKQRGFEDVADTLIAGSVPLEDFNLFKTQTEEFVVVPEDDKLNEFIDPETDNTPATWDFSETEEETLPAAEPEKEAEIKKEPEVKKEIKEEKKKPAGSDLDMVGDLLDPDREMVGDLLDPDFEMVGDLLDPEDMEPLINEFSFPSPDVPESILPEPEPFTEENPVISETVNADDISVNLNLDDFDNLLMNDEPDAAELGLTEESEDNAGNDDELNRKLDLLVDMNTFSKDVDFQYDEEFLSEDDETEKPAEETDFNQLLAEAEDEINTEELSSELQTEEETEPEPSAAPPADPQPAGEMVELGKKKKWIGSLLFWLIAASFVLLTTISTYYFLFMRKKSSEPNEAAKVETQHQPPAEVKPEIIERNDEIPVTAVVAAPEENKTSQSEQPKEVKTGSEANTQTPEKQTAGNQTAGKQSAENKTESPAVQKQNPVQTPPSQLTAQNSKTPQSKQQTPAAVPDKRTETDNAKAKKAAEEKQKTVTAGINPKQTEKPKTSGSTPVENKTAAAGTEETYRNLFRNDNKDRMVKQNIFSDGSKFAIQMSSWPSVAKAASEVNKFRGMGYQAYILKFKLKNDKPWYRVRIGDFSSINDADAVLNKISK